MQNVGRLPAQAGRLWACSMAAARACPANSAPAQAGRLGHSTLLGPNERPKQGYFQAVARGFIPRAFLRGEQGPALRRVSLVAARGYVHCRAPGSVVVVLEIAASAGFFLTFWRDFFDFPDICVILLLKSDVAGGVDRRVGSEGERTRRYRASSVRGCGPRG